MRELSKQIMRNGDEARKVYKKEAKNEARKVKKDIDMKR